MKGKFQSWYTVAMTYVIDACIFGFGLLMGLNLLLSGHRLTWILLGAVGIARLIIALLQLLGGAKEGMGKPYQRTLRVELIALGVYAVLAVALCLTFVVCGGGYWKS